MAKIHCARKMREVLTAIEAWNQENSELLWADAAAPECEEDWNPDYAIIEFSIEATHISKYIDTGLAQSDLHAIVKKVLGPKFVTIPPYVSKYPRKVGELYLVFWGREIEIYRYKGKATR